MMFYAQHTKQHEPREKPPTIIVRALPKATAPIMLNIGDQVMIGGTLYAITPTLTPVAAPPAPLPIPTPVPTPPPSPAPPTPQVSEYRDATRQFAINAVAGGKAFSINGSGFGAVKGTVVYGGVLALPIIAWADSFIILSAPPFVSGQPLQMWTIRRADATEAGGWHEFLGPPILPP